MTAEAVVRLPSRLPWQNRASSVVNAPNVRFSAVCMGRRAGKSTWIADDAGEFLLSHPRHSVLWVAPTYDLSNIGRDLFMQFWRPAVKNYHASERAATMLNDATMLFRSSDNPDSLVGRGHHRIYADEAALISDLAMKRSLMPAIADKRGSIIAPSTPRGTRGFFAEWIRRAMSGQQEYSYVQGPSTENPNPSVREYVEQMRRDLPEDLFRQEFLGELIADADVVFRDVRSRMTSEVIAPVAGHTYALGVDLARHADYTVTAPIDLKTGSIGPLQRYHGLSWEQIENRIVAEQVRWNNATVYIDATGVGDAVVESITRKSGCAVYPIVFTNEAKSELVIGLASALEKNLIALPPDDGLLAEMNAFKYERLPSGKYRYAAEEGMHDDRVVALALAVNAFNTLPHRGLFDYYERQITAKPSQHQEVTHAA